VVAQATAFDNLKARAREMANGEFVKAKIDDIPEWLAKLDYDGYRRIRFRTDMALWAGDKLPFSVHFMHRGYLFRRRIPIHVVDGTTTHELRFSPQQFDYSGKPPADPPGDLGYAGLALRAWSEPNDRWEEFASFLGASYFRIVPLAQPWGLSARGLAIDTGTSRGEEFPEWVEFRLEKPALNATTLTLYALLDSPSTAGAFRFVITPGTPTKAQVTAAFYPRHGVEKFGVAPLTSMFMCGEMRPRPVVDWRPEVHDSDGLLVASSDGTWTWRPLNNPDRTHRITRIPLENPVGFGLLQRDRNFESYQDLESRFEQRPSYWIEPRGGWGKGAVELVEIPSNGEWNDNIVAYWVPEKPPVKGEELVVEYTLTAYRDDATKPPLARAIATRMRPGKDETLFVIDFKGVQVANASDGDAPDGLRADIVATRGEIRKVIVQPNAPLKGARCTFEWVDSGADPVDIRVTLRRGQEAVSETLLVQWVRP
jgi:glucans biosynthesis protein